MLESRGQVDIDQPPEAVFDFLADMRNEPKWLPGASDVRLTSEGDVAEGSTFEGTYARAGVVHCRISNYERPHRLNIHGDAKSLAFDEIITLTSTARGTHLEAVMRSTPKGLFRV